MAYRRGSSGEWSTNDLDISKPAQCRAGQPLCTHTRGVLIRIIASAKRDQLPLPHPTLFPLAHLIQTSASPSRQDPIMAPRMSSLLNVVVRRLKGRYDRRWGEEKSGEEDGELGGRELHCGRCIREGNGGLGLLCVGET